MKIIKLNSLWLLLILSFEIFLAVESFGLLVAFLWGGGKKMISINQTNKNKAMDPVLF